MKTPENAADNNVGRKTPEEIKKGLASCKVQGTCDHGNCPYHSLDGGTRCIPAMSADALAYIQQLEAELQREKDHHQYTIDAANVMKDEALKLESRLAQAERERDAAIYDMCYVAPAELCDACANSKEPALCEEVGFICRDCPQECPCKNCLPDRSNFVHRGPCPENTKEETK